MFERRDACGSGNANAIHGSQSDSDSNSSYGTDVDDLFDQDELHDILDTEIPSDSGSEDDQDEVEHEDESNDPRVPTTIEQLAVIQERSRELFGS